MGAQLENGARFSFTRLTPRHDLDTVDVVEYRVVVEQPRTEDHVSICSLTAAESTWTWEPGANTTELAGWMVDMRDAYARQVQRAGSRGKWPQKLRHWKAEPST